MKFIYRTFYAVVWNFVRKSQNYEDLGVKGSLLLKITDITIWNLSCQFYLPC